MVGGCRPMWLARRVASAGVQEARRPEGANKFCL